MPSVAPIPIEVVSPARTRLRVRGGVGWADVFAVFFGITMTLVVGGYQFGRSNHTVYLLDALHRIDPRTLANDWFTTQTFQYHALFGLLTQALWSRLQPAFLVGYLGLAVALHVGWFQLTRLLGGGRVSYLLSVLFLYLSGGGTALGIYTFLQDSAFLPSNVASVALLCGIVLWMRRKLAPAGAMFGVAALFHLNYAVVAPVLWGVMWLCDAWMSRGNAPVADDDDEGATVRPWANRAMWVGTLLAILPAGVAVLLALRAMPRTGMPMPLGEFVDLYVRLRHPHHYDPRGWPRLIWVSFLWPVLPALVGAIRVRRDAACSHPVVVAWRRASWAFVFFMALTGVAVVWAGWTFVSERLVQMSLFRFSIYPHLLACVGASVWLCEGKPLGKRTRPIVAAFVALVTGGTAFVALNGGQLVAYTASPAAAYQAVNHATIKLLAMLSVVPLWVLWVDHVTRRRQQIYAAATVAGAALLLWGATEGYYGLVRTPVDPTFAKVSQWARSPYGSPPDAVFLVPPDEETFRLVARRAIVVNYKGVPQTSRELGQWRDRLSDVLDLPDLRTLPKGMSHTLAAIRRRYDELPAEHLVNVARKYGARYVVATRPLNDPAMKQVFEAGAGGRRYVVYDLGKTGKP